MNQRIAALGALAGVVAILFACSPDRTPRIPPGTPNCEETCNAAWPCGGVLENDLDTCLALCDEEEHGSYRVCIAETECEEMYICKIEGPSDVVIEDTDAPE